MKRREFVKAMSLMGSSTLFNKIPLIHAKTRTFKYFNLHPFIESHPEAVFVLKTDISTKTDSTAKYAWVAPKPL